MKVCFTGFDAPIHVDDEAVSVLELANRALFARACCSLASGLGADALEPYSLWHDADAELKPGAHFMLIASPLELPWDDKLLLGGLAARLEKMAFEDEGCVSPSRRPSRPSDQNWLRSRLDSIRIMPSV